MLGSGKRPLEVFQEVKKEGRKEGREGGREGGMEGSKNQRTFINLD